MAIVKPHDAGTSDGDVLLHARDSPSEGEDNGYTLQVSLTTVKFPFT